MRDSEGSIIKNTDGTPVEGYQAIDNKTGKISLVGEDALKSDKYTAIGANSPKELKTLFSNLTLTNKAKQTYKVDTNKLVNLNTLIGSANIKEGVNPLLNPKAANAVKSLIDVLPSLTVTDSLRHTNSKTGDENSEHKYANAVDFRIRDPKTNAPNKDAETLLNYSQGDLESLGIKSVELHNNTHLHVTFLK